MIEIKGRKLYILQKKDRAIEIKDYIAPFHRVLRITLLSSGEVYAVDLAGAQFGHGGSISTWKQYVQSCVKRIIEVSPRGETKVWLQRELSEDDFYWKETHANNVSNFVDLDCRVNKLSMDALLRLPDAEYDDKRQGLLRKFNLISDAFRIDFVKHLISMGSELAR